MQGSPPKQREFVDGNGCHSQHELERELNQAEEEEEKEVNGGGREEEEEDSEEECAEHELVVVVIARVDSVPKHVPLFAHEEARERFERGDLNRKEALRKDEETDMTKIEKLEKVVQGRERKGGTQWREEEDGGEDRGEVGGDEVDVEVLPELEE